MQIYHICIYKGIANPELCHLLARGTTEGVISIFCPLQPHCDLNHLEWKGTCRGKVGQKTVPPSHKPQHYIPTIWLWYTAKISGHIFLGEQPVRIPKPSNSGCTTNFPQPLPWDFGESWPDGRKSRLPSTKTEIQRIFFFEAQKRSKITKKVWFRFGTYPPRNLT